MSDNSIQMNIERIVDIFKEDIKENAESSYLYSYFKPKSSSEIKGDESSEEANNSDNKNTGIDKKIHKKTQDFLSTNKLGKTESISAKMLLGLCEYNEKWRTPVAEIFSSSIDIDKDIDELEKLLKKIKKDALIPIKIEVNTGAVLYIRYRTSCDWGLDYVFFYPWVDEIFDVEKDKKYFDEVESKCSVHKTYKEAKVKINIIKSMYSAYKTYQEAKDGIDEYLDDVKTEFEFKNLNNFYLSEKFQMQYGKFMTKKSVNEIVNEQLGKENADFEPLI